MLASDIEKTSCHATLIWSYFSWANLNSELDESPGNWPKHHCSPGKLNQTSQATVKWTIVEKQNKTTTTQNSITAPNTQMLSYELKTDNEVSSHTQDLLKQGRNSWLWSSSCLPQPTEEGIASYLICNCGRRYLFCEAWIRAVLRHLSSHLCIVLNPFYNFLFPFKTKFSSSSL